MKRKQYHTVKAHLVRNVQSVHICRQPHVRLLVPVRPDERVYLRHLDIVHPLDRLLDLVLGRPHVTHKNKGVVLLNLLHGGFRVQGELEDGEDICAAGLARGRSARVFRLAGETEGLGPVEVDVRPRLSRGLALHALDDGLLGSGGFRRCRGSG